VSLTQIATKLGDGRRQKYGGGISRSKSSRMNRPNRIDFAAVNRAAMMVLPTLLARWLPRGRTEGAEFVALNPRRADRHLGSFRVNTRTGRWCDFALEGARGGDVISLATYLGGIGQAEAARRLAAMLGIEVRRGG
jgi:hypothetical protein